MRVLVTGGAGFIGSHIIDALVEAGHECAALDDLSSGSRDNLPDGVPLFEADIRDEAGVANAFSEFRPDGVCHQAAQLSVSRSVANPMFDAEVNVLGLLNVLQQAHRHQVGRFVFASSGGVLYGDVTEPSPEETPPNPISPYGITKLTGELYLKFFVREHGLKAVALRYSNVYGPRQNPHGEAGVVAIFCQKMLAGERARINGDGKYDRDYVYGPDVAQANRLALTVDLPEGFSAFNIGTAVTTDVNELAAVVRRECQDWLRQQGSTIVVPELEHGPARPGDLRSNVVDYTKATRQLGWRP
ncbi:MAG: NAD-dependent epimerase/dehydratase family protein, partial [Planctomycetaceae bacterium]|nr:NAD-dependent epimerase/dehydratase family protein [Planctomycetaceae bacterium]